MADEAKPKRKRRNRKQPDPKLEAVRRESEALQAMRQSVTYLEEVRLRLEQGNKQQTQEMFRLRDVLGERERAMAILTNHHAAVRQHIDELGEMLERRLGTLYEALQDMKGELRATREELKPEGDEQEHQD
jgi:hypothetical protein